MTTRLARPRAGFTLIEMLIVISIIATLAAISVGAFFQVRGAQDKTVTEVTLNKLHSTFDTKYKAVLDDARITVPDSLVTLCGNDRQRAQVVWTLAKLKNEFPQTKAEATSTYTVAIPGGTLAPRKAISAVAATLPADPTGTDEAAAVQRAKISSALMYAALTATGGGGTMGGSEGLQQQVKTDGGLQYFRDSYDMPIGFLRAATNNEIKTKPSYTKGNLTQIGGSMVNIVTAFDPRGLMIEAPANTAYRTGFATALGVDLANPDNEFNNVNRLATFYSAGPNKEFGSDPVSLTVDEALDNLLSYRLRREGAKGD